jgi:hypothetical protein
MLLTLFLALPLLATGAIAVMAPPLLGAATVLAIAWAGLAWTFDRCRANRSS